MSVKASPSSSSSSSEQFGGDSRSLCSSFARPLYPHRRLYSPAPSDYSQTAHLFIRSQHTQNAYVQSACMGSRTFQADTPATGTYSRSASAYFPASSTGGHNQNQAHPFRSPTSRSNRYEPPSYPYPSGNPTPATAEDAAAAEAEISFPHDLPEPADAAHGVKKRTRLMTTDHQTARLNEVLQNTIFPTVSTSAPVWKYGNCSRLTNLGRHFVLSYVNQTAQREQLAIELDMTPRRIQVWFQVSSVPHTHDLAMQLTRSHISFN